MRKILVSACLLGVKCRYDAQSREYPALETLRERFELIPFCPEAAGGLPTPRTPAEITANGVFTRDGRDVTNEYRLGAQKALALAKKEGITLAVLKSLSPSCGKDRIYDGTFSRTVVAGQGIAAQLLLENGIEVFSEEEIPLLLKSEP